MNEGQREFTVWHFCEILDRIAQYDQIKDYTRRAAAIYEAMGYAIRLGYQAGIREDPGLCEEIRSDWPVCYIVLPTGQVSWHVESYKEVWDGHTTDEKYERIRDYVYAMELC